MKIPAVQWQQVGRQQAAQAFISWAKRGFREEDMQTIMEMVTRRAEQIGGTHADVWLQAFRDEWDAAIGEIQIVAQCMTVEPAEA